MPGKYLKRATQACASKNAFPTQLDAERTSEYRFKAYQCAVCHQWHLTSKGGPAKRPIEQSPEDAPAERPFRTFADAVKAQIEARKGQGEVNPSMMTSPHSKDTESTESREVRQEARCISQLRKDHRVMLAIAGCIVKSRPVLPALRARVREGAWVRVAPIEGSAIILEVLT